ncbi:HNH endonuclease signature motif containing protein [Streptomyces sp. NPDC017943]|uniref:HNH endonuclease signature motif containing protein n=1 Tax=Streptomyces sp. NPDC017943 TaxID=3365019 RepID=UPI0037BE04F5
MSRESDLKRFWLNVAKRDDGCWFWTASKNTGGYGHFMYGGQRGNAHRFAYEALVGPIPEGLVLDHLCRVRHCVNPDHLEPVTMRVNSLRGEGPSAKNAVKTHCKQGHEFSASNTYVTPRGRRQCRTCQRSRQRTWRRSAA